VTGSIAAAAADLRSGRTTCAQLAVEALESLRRWEPHMNAWIDFSTPLALAHARRLDHELESGHDRGPLHGIPIGVKDNILTADFPTTCASRAPMPATASRASGAEADSVTALRDAGAIIIGKTNLHELAMGNPYIGEVANPFDLSRNASGSSSGTAAATAAGTIFGGLGTDSGGSIRLPAAVCGVVGFKPAYSRVSLRGLLGGSYTMDHIGPIARSVDDVRLIYSVIRSAGPSPAETARTDRIVVGHVTRLSMADPDEEITARVGEAAERLARQGMEVREVSLEGLELLPYAAIGYAWPEISSHHRAGLRGQRKVYGDAVRPLLDLGEIISARQYGLAQRSRSYFLRQVISGMAGVDVLLMPTTPMTAGPMVADADTKAVVGGDSPDLFRFTRYTLPWNVIGFPAMSVPCGLDGDGLPIGAQLVARPRDEELVFTVASAHEAAFDWGWPQHPTPVAGVEA
jgi:aspartyl-tRNA(Asn)/glutamyl-tRNA(Gln) amidotransferase subunit A